MRNFNVTTMENLKARALHVKDGMGTYFPQFSKHEELKVSNLKTEPKTYAYNNSVVAFVDEKGDFYAIPDINGIQKLLVENGYRKTYFYVPFSNWDYPVDCKEYWEYLWEIKNAK